jgi:hypothetical protein
MSKYDAHATHNGDILLGKFIEKNENIFYVVIVLNGFFVEDGKIYFRFTVFPERGFHGACAISHMIDGVPAINDHHPCENERIRSHTFKGVTNLKSKEDVRTLLNFIFERSGIKRGVANAFLNGKNSDKDFILIIMDRTRMDDNVCSTIIDILNEKHPNKNIQFSQFMAGSYEEVAISIPTDCFNNVATISDTFSV